MTAAELSGHQTAVHGRDYSVSDDGYGDMAAAEDDGWRAIPGWGRDGWDLGDWPYVIIYKRDVPGEYQLQQITEGDHTAYSFGTAEDRDAAIDYLFLWYSAGQDWSPVTYEGRAMLDEGTLTVPDRYRGPYRAR